MNSSHRWGAVHVDLPPGPQHPGGDLIADLHSVGRRAEVDARIRTGMGLRAPGDGGATVINDRALSPWARDMHMARRNHMNDELLGDLQ